MEDVKCLLGVNNNNKTIFFNDTKVTDPPQKIQVLGEQTNAGGNGNVPFP